MYELGTERARVLEQVQSKQKQLVSVIVRTIAREIPFYASHPDREFVERDVRDHVTHNVLMFLRGASGDQPPQPSELGFIGDAVERRVAQGVALDDVLHAFRVGQRVLWETVVSEARALDASPEAVLSLVLPALQYADAAASEFTERYVRIEQQQRTSAERANDEVAGALLAGRLPGERALARLRRAFPVRGEQRYLVAVVLVAVEERLDEVRRELLTAHPSGGIEGVVAQVAEQQLVVIFAVRDEPEDAAPAQVLGRIGQLHSRPLPDAQIGTGDVGRGLPGIKSSWDEARRAAARAAPGETVAVHRLTPLERFALLAGDLPSADRIVPERLRRFITAQLEADVTLLDTAEAYVACDLNASETAARLALHRNTVRYRLARIGELAGVDHRRSRDMFELVLAIAVMRASRSRRV